MSFIYKRRWRRIARLLKKKRNQAFVVKIPSNIRYLYVSHMPYSSSLATHLVIFNDSSAVAIVPVLEAWRAENEGASDAEIHLFGKLSGVKTDSDTMAGALKKVLKERKVKRALCDSRERVRGVGFAPDRMITDMRMIKDEGEIRNIKRACSITDKAGRQLSSIIRAGRTEREVQLKLNTIMKMSGGDTEAFPTIAAAGPFSAYPHHEPTRRKIRKGEPVTCDFGAIYKGYCADMTRTYFAGRPSKKLSDVYHAVYEAQKAGVRAARAGVPIPKVDEATREVIREYGYEKYYCHSTGHGLGLDVHEEPRIASGVRMNLRVGMVFTVEPGIYIPKLGGVRIEDDVWVKGRTQSQVLNRTKKPRYW